MEDADSFCDRVLEAVVGRSLKAADEDLAAGRTVGLKDWAKRRSRRVRWLFSRPTEAHHPDPPLEGGGERTS